MVCYDTRSTVVCEKILVMNFISEMGAISILFQLRRKAMCVCVCVFEREREREREQGAKEEIVSDYLIKTA